MISLGYNITSATDQLRKINPDQLHGMIVRSRPELISLIEQLRTVLTISPEKYTFLKRKLPYFTGGIFHPAYRKTTNFNYIEYFVLDVDHLSQKNLKPPALKKRLAGDSRIVLMFISPSNDGLKILLRLSEKCHDPAKFSLFYKVFSREFSKQYELDQVIDTKTSDVTRACFLSYDEHAYYRADPEPVVITRFVDFENQLTTGELEKVVRQEEKEQVKVTDPDEPDERLPLSADALQEIKQKLNPRIKLKQEKNYFVPEQIDRVIPLIESGVKAFNIDLKEVQPIHYGKKLVFSLDQYWAEVNIFYGKNGYSAVKTPKRGSHEELADIVHKIICEIIYGTG
ncbi:MAG: CRISPR-associated primase-polymerase type B [Bacteroidales bacterium]